jgi:predicted ATPase
MLSKLRVQHYKSLFDTEVTLEPLTVFIGPNGSGKSNVCEAIALLSSFLQYVMQSGSAIAAIPAFSESLSLMGKTTQNLESKFWHGETNYFSFDVQSTSSEDHVSPMKLSVRLDYPAGVVSITLGEESVLREKLIDGSRIDFIKRFLVSNEAFDTPVMKALGKVLIYDFAPLALAVNASTLQGMDSTGKGVAESLADILLNNRKSFDELENRLNRLVPNIKRVALPRKGGQTFLLELVDKYSEHHIPASDVSDGTLRILAFLTALYQENTPSIICFEEIENGIHPWLLGKMMELLKIVSTEGITGKPVQVLITTHSPVLLNYVEPHQVRAVELDDEGKTQVHSLPTDSVRFQKALEAYDGSLGELWFTNVFGGNPV